MKTNWLRGKLSRKRQELAQQQAELGNQINRLLVEVGAGTRGATKKLAKAQLALKDIKRQFAVLDSKQRAWNRIN